VHCAIRNYYVYMVYLFTKKKQVFLLVRGIFFLLLDSRELYLHCYTLQGIHSSERKKNYPCLISFYDLVVVVSAGVARGRAAPADERGWWVVVVMTTHVVVVAAAVEVVETAKADVLSGSVERGAAEGSGSTT
jgi:hypothetical protein